MEDASHRLTDTWYLGITGELEGLVDTGDSGEPTRVYGTPMADPFRLAPSSDDSPTATAPATADSSTTTATYLTLGWRVAFG